MSSSSITAPLVSRGSRPWLVALAGAAVALVFLALYLGGEARGRMSFLTLPAAHWGMPPSLAEKGLEPLYLDPREAGWDGQFYYRMANDPLGTGDASPHIDSPSYRYQRVGMSAAAWALAQVTFQDWVTPCTFYATSLIALFVATWALARFYSSAGNSPWLALVWSLGLGTQLTLLNGLPDGFAEAMLVIALVAISRPQPRMIIYSIAMTMAVLSREAYVLAAAGFGVLHCLRLLQGDAAALVDRSRFAAEGGVVRWFISRIRALVSGELRVSAAISISALIVPGVVFAVWQYYLRAHFGKAPADQAGGILAPFLHEYLRFFRAALAGTHPIWGTDVPGTHRELAMLVVFAVMLVLFFAVAAIVLFRIRDFKNPAIYVLAFVPVIFLYLFFGRIVMMHFSGYLKAANLILFLVPVALVSLPISRVWWRRGAFGLTLLCASIGTAQFIHDKVLAGSLRLARPSTLFENGHYHNGLKIGKGQDPLTSFSATLRIAGSSSFFVREMFRELRGAPEMRIFDVDVTNQGHEPYALAEGMGAVRLSYHWLSRDGASIAKDGLRTFFQAPLAPGETQRVRMYVEYPVAPGEYILRLSLVQEGVSWFYLQGSGFTDLRVTVR